MNANQMGIPGDVFDYQMLEELREDSDLSDSFATNSSLANAFSNNRLNEI